MKEYWVNVLNVEYCSINGKLHHRSQRDAITYSNRVCNNPIYRLHVREFNTREAKELYLKMKYGSKYTHDDFINDIQDIYA